jgi:hypothetical protein
MKLAQSGENFRMQTNSDEELEHPQYSSAALHKALKVGYCELLTKSLHQHRHISSNLFMDLMKLMGCNIETATRSADIVLVALDPGQ